MKYRPDVSSVLADITAIKDLKGGPADATAFHDFHTLQIAFENVWVHAFGENVKYLTKQLYEETVKIYDDAGVEMPAIDQINDINDINDINALITSAQQVLGNTGTGAVVISAPPANPGSIITPAVQYAFPQAYTVWRLLSDEQRASINETATMFMNSTDAGYKSSLKNDVQNILKHPQGSAIRIEKLILELGKSLNEPYAFDIFAPNSYNFGIMLTYRQKWEPKQYQAGDLRATIPLAPGEKRKYTKKTNIKRTRSEKETEKAISSRSEQSSSTSRAEAEIMQKTTTTTNFKMSADGSLNIEVANIKASSEFTYDQIVESASNKKEFHEATLKAAQEYRLERCLEIDTTSSAETEETYSSEISNPNNEITVTYLFYELQRIYTVSEMLHRARPVILVAQDVPAPHEIDEAWLIKYQWITSRVLLDDSFRPALSYLTSGMAGDEVAIEAIKVHWNNKRNMANALEAQVNAQLTQRDNLRAFLVQTAFDKTLAEAAQGLLSIGV